MIVALALSTDKEKCNKRTLELEPRPPLGFFSAPAEFSFRLPEWVLGRLY